MYHFFSLYARENFTTTEYCTCKDSPNILFTVIISILLGGINMNENIYGYVRVSTKEQNLDRQLVKEQTDSYVTKLKEAGMTITTPDLKAFQAATSGVMDVFTNVYGEELLQKLRAWSSN